MSGRAKKENRMLVRAGLELVPLSYSQWSRDRERCLKSLGERIVFQ